jgi:hypothetical protein
MFFTAWPHMKSDFAFFTKHPLCGSFLRFQPNYPILSEKQLHRVLRAYIKYFNETRPHQGLHQQVPQVILSSQIWLIPKKSEPACLLKMHVSMWRIGATESIMLQSLRSV